MDVDKTLARIDYSGPLDVNFEVLRDLQHAWLDAVPFENLDIHAGVPILLDPKRFYRKIVLNRRGGFCYESNTLFHDLLKALGFDVRIIAARMALEERPGPGYSHMALLVTLEQAYLVDAGNGQSVRDPMPVPGDLITVAEGIQYHVGPCENEHALYYRIPGNAWAPRYIFATTPRNLEDFREMCHYHQSSPESIFTKQRICTMPTPDGRVTLTGTTFSVRYAGSEDKFVAGSAAELEQMLQKYFKISVQIPYFSS